jgi:hypothetical protein
MDDEAILAPSRKSFPKLLQCLLSRGVRRHIALQDTSRSELEDHEHIEELEFGGDCHHEVTSDDRIGVVAYECRPVLRRSSSRSRVIYPPWPVLANGSGRYENPQLQT